MPDRILVFSDSYVIARNVAEQDIGLRRDQWTYLAHAHELRGMRSVTVLDAVRLGPAPGDLRELQRLADIEQELRQMARGGCRVQLMSVRLLRAA